MKKGIWHLPGSSRTSCLQALPIGTAPCQRDPGSSVPMGRVISPILCEGGSWKMAFCLKQEAEFCVCLISICKIWGMNYTWRWIQRNEMITGQPHSYLSPWFGTKAIFVFHSPSSSQPKTQDNSCRSQSWEPICVANLSFWKRLSRKGSLMWHKGFPLILHSYFTWIFPKTLKSDTWLREKNTLKCSLA